MTAVESLDLEALKESGAHRFDPVRFCFIESMARRAQSQRDAVRKIVEQKALKALNSYLADFSKSKKEAATAVARITENFPAAAESIQRLFDTCNFKEAHRLESTLQQAKIRSPIADLTDRLVEGSATSVEKKAGHSFDDILLQQENAALQSISDSVSSPASGMYGTSGELKSIRHFRESLAKINADKRVEQAIRDVPENSGPLNPQMLVIRSLATMRDLSPHYLNRFVSYIDTLLWLEQANENANMANTKNAAGKTSGKKTKRRKN